MQSSKHELFWPTQATFFAKQRMPGSTSKSSLPVLVYHWLVENNLSKSAKKLKKQFELTEDELKAELTVTLEDLSSSLQEPSRKKRKVKDQAKDSISENVIVAKADEQPVDQVKQDEDNTTSNQADNSKTESPKTNSNANGKTKEKNVPFKRVREEEVEFLDERLKDNTYTGKGGESYGLRAHQDLIVTRGKGFRAEKTKKKRGSYRGGKIDTLGSHSIKFNDSDAE